MSAEGTDDQHTGTHQDAATNDDDRPKPYPHEGDSRPAEEKSDDGARSPANDENDSTDENGDSADENGKPEQTGDAEDVDFHYPDDEDGQEYVDRSVIDFDPADGLYTGTAVTGDSDIPDPDEVVKEENEGGDGDTATSDKTDDKTDDDETDDDETDDKDD